MGRYWIASLAAVGVALLSILFTNPFYIFAPPPLPSSLPLLHSAAVLPVTGAVGPESLAFDPNGDGPYTGVADGRILKWLPHAHAWADFAFTSPDREWDKCNTWQNGITRHLSADIYAIGEEFMFQCSTYKTPQFVRKECVRPFAPEMEHICGRPLGLRFDKKTGDLYIADAYLGLHVVRRDGGLATPVITEVKGRPLLFTNDMDIDDEEDAIYFSDTSKVFQRRQFVAAVLSGDNTGRLLKYDKLSKKVTVLVEGLAFANGVSLSKDRSFILVAETTTCKILRLWLRGPNVGKVEIFAKLPGFPDNIRRNSEGEFWVALHSKKGIFAKLALSNSWIGKALLKLPLSIQQLHSLLVGGKAHATAVKLSNDGSIVEILEDLDGKTLRFISEVEEKDGKLWIGSVLMPFVGVHNL